MADSEKQVSYGVTADASPFEAGMQRAADAARGAAQNIDSNFRKVQDAFGQVQKQLLLLAGVVAGGAFFKEAISASNQLTGETMKLSRALDISAEEAGTLRTALDDIGSSGDEYVEVFNKFARQIKNNEDGLKAYGLQTRDANGDLRNSKELFSEALSSVGQYKSGLDQNTYAQTMFGKSIDDVMKLQKLNNDVMEEAKRKNAELGLIITKENVESSKAYKLAMNDVGDVLKAVNKIVGDAVMPVFTEMGQYLASTGPYVVEVFKGAMLGLLVVFETIKAAVKSVAVIIFETINQAVDIVGLLGEMFVKLVKGDYAGVYEAGQKIGARLKEGFVNAASGITDSVKEGAAAVGKDFERLYGPKVAADGPKGGGSRRMGDFKDTKDTTRVSTWDAELQEQKLAYQEQQNAAGTFYQMTKQQELAFWQEKLALTEGGTAENIAVRRKAAELQQQINADTFSHEVAALQAQEAAYKQNAAERLALLDHEAELVRQRYGDESKEYEAVQKKIVEAKRQSVEQQKQIDMMRADAARSAQMAEVHAAEQQARLEVDLRLITVDQQLALEQQFEARRYQINLQGLRERLEIAKADPDRSPVELARIQAEIEGLELQHQLRLGEIKGQAARQQAKYVTSSYDAMQSGFASVIAKTLRGTQSLTKMFRGLFQTLVSVVTDALAKMAAEWLMVQIKNMIMGKAMALASVTEKSGEAGAAGVASMAGAPWPLNMTAPAFGAAMAAAAMAYAPLASAAGGYDIPSTVNPLVQAHASEMVLPAKQADVIRRLADDDQGSGAGGRQEQALTIVKVHPMPGNFFMVHRAQLVAALKGARRDFEL